MHFGYSKNLEAEDAEPNGSAEKDASEVGIAIPSVCCHTGTSIRITIHIRSSEFSVGG